MNAYQREQFDAYSMAEAYIRGLSPTGRDDILNRARSYLGLRRTIDRFLSHTFSETCTANCFTSRVSACCSKEGIVTFFGDVLLNTLLSAPEEVQTSMQRLQRPNDGFKCVYLGEGGCSWRLKPSVCVMFVCDAALNSAAGRDPESVERWESLRGEEKKYRWPDNPHETVLFDWLEAVCIKAGYDSPLMYLHKSPGLLRVKKRAGISSP